MKRFISLINTLDWKLKKTTVVIRIYLSTTSPIINIALLVTPFARVVGKLLRVYAFL